MTRGRGERGMTLPEVLIAMSLMLVILAASLGTFSTMQRNSEKTRKLNALQEDTRNLLDVMAKGLRNVASRADNVSHPIDRATPQDLIYQVVSSTAPTTYNPASVQRVRYCLDNQRRLWQQTQTLADASVAAPTAAACPANSGWTTQRNISTAVTNGNRAVFTYLLAGPAPARFTEATTVPDSDDLALERIVGIRTELFVDDNVAKAPPESTLTTRVFLRNQNRRPTASFVAVSTAGMSLQLNGGDSDDPEGARLTFEWFDSVPAANTKLGEGSVFNYRNMTAGSHAIYLKVSDPAGNYAVTPAQAFSCTTTGGCQ